MTDADITHLAATHTEHERLRALADHVPAMLAYWDENQRCRYANRAYETWFGRKAETVVGLTLAELLGDLYVLDAPHIAAALRGEAQHFEREIPDPAGGPARLSQTHYIPDLADGRVRGFYVLATDVTHRAKAEDAGRDLERQAHATERLSAIATLTQGIAHEINNPLAIALLGLDDALEQLDAGEMSPEALRESLLSAREGMNRMAGIVQSMKLLARLDATERGPVDVKVMVEESIALATPQIRYRARLSSELDDVGFIDGDGAQVSQVFVSLLMNVAKSLPEEHSERNEIRVATRRAGASIVVEVSDNAPGSPGEVRQRAFDRFFTTGDIPGGIGLGLSVARDIVTALGGTLQIESPTGGGTLFRVTLRAAPEQLALRTGAEGPVSETPARSTFHRGLGRRGRVLVIDDEPLVGRSLKRHLSPRYDVETVTHGRKAIERAIAERYDVILCDLMMPDVSGAEVYAEVTTARPELASRFVFMTGGAFTPRGREFLQSVSAPVLGKPFDLPVLEATVRRVASSSPLAGDVQEAATGRPGSRD